MISIILAPLSFVLAWVNGYMRWKRGESHIRERLGLWGNVPSRVVWLHGASVGECLSLKLLLSLLCQRSQVPILLTTTTTAARTVMEKFHHLVRHQVWDVWPLVAWRLYRTRPLVWVTVESEIWPVWIWTLRRMKVPMMILNARLSVRAMRRWRRFPWVAKSVFGGISYATTTCQERAQFLRMMGVHHVEYQPHLKYLSEPLPVVSAACDAYQKAIGDRPLWMAASVHPSEGAAIIQAMRELPGALTILAPRHIHTVDAWCSQLQEHGFQGIKHSEFNGYIEKDVNYIIVDSMGELPVFYSLSPIVLVGGNLVPGIGGHNIMEPGTFGCAVIWGPYVDNCRDVCDELAPYGYPLHDADALASTIQHLLKHPGEVQHKGQLIQENLALKRQVLQSWSHAWISRICSMSGMRCLEDVETSAPGSIINSHNRMSS